MDDLRSAVGFARSAWSLSPSKILVSCDYGASRSPALAYVLVADQLGPGREPEALDVTLQIRPDAVPNRLVVKLGDMLLGREGNLVKALSGLYTKLNEEISKWRAH
jgi:predicted protein tyrosine phosphatase